MPSVLITGTSRGLGREFAAQYAKDGWRVFAGARDPARAFAESSASGAGDVRPLALDVESDASLAAAARTVGEPLDLLIANAGIYGPKPGGLDDLDFAQWEAVLRVIVVGAMRSIVAFLPHLERGRGRIVAAISSEMGSIANNRGGRPYAYRSSKAALNMTVANLALDLGPRGWTVVALHPGWVRTDMGGPRADLSVGESVSALRRVLSRLGFGDNGRFIDRDGSTLPW